VAGGRDADGGADGIGAETLAADWTHPYTRLEAAYPGGDPDSSAKYWPPVSRIDNVAGDRNLVCACPPVSEYLGAAE
jgi:glycine dehydrogenase